uniref:IU_nuc_hydro domain-containing protein n=1 Tax=Globodera pallida TaxID=36090 RepID=A0A183BRI9_GLOPA
MKKKLVIDSDGVSDDVRAISMALQTQNVEVLALTAVNGCVSVHQACANMSRMLRANHDEHFFGNDGLGSAPNQFPKVLPDDFNAFVEGKHAALALYELFSSNPGTVLVCIGPLTNVALALKLNPTFACLPEQMVILGGNVYGMGNVQSYSTAECNFNCDPEAAQIVLKEMQCPITIVPWETFMAKSDQTHDIDFHSHLALDVPLAKFFATVTSVGRARLEANNRQFAYCDEVAVGIAIAEETIIRESKMLRASVELHGELTRGQIAVDWTSVLYQMDKGEHPKLCKQRRPIKFVLDYDVHQLDRMIIEAIENSAANLDSAHINGYC